MFILDTDASENTTGDVLSQKQNGKKRVVSYWSRILSKAERQYSVTKKEMLAVAYFVKHYRHYLLGRKFLIRTDHSALRSHMKTKEPERQTTRCVELLATFNFEIRHRPGKRHVNVDVLSRIPVRKQKPQETVTATVSTNEDNNFPSVQEAQMKHSELKMVQDWVEKGERPLWVKVSGRCYRVKSYWSQFQDCVSTMIAYAGYGMNDKNLVDIR